MSVSKIGWCTWTCKQLVGEVQSTAGGQGRDQQVDEELPREDEGVWQKRFFAYDMTPSWFRNPALVHYL